jgi:hypothetical protein
LPNHSYLLTANTSAPPQTLPNADPGFTELCFGCNTMPGLWLAFFEPECRLVQGEAADADGEPAEYACLVTEAGAGILRARQRSNNIIAAIGRERRPKLEAWIQYIEDHAKAYLWWDPCEILGMAEDSDEFVTMHREALSGFGAEPWEMAGWLRKRRKLTTPWGNLLASVDDPGLHQLHAYELWGHPSIQPAPWDSDEKI